MKKVILLIILIIASIQLSAQQGEIIINDFDPDSVLHIEVGFPNELFIDIDLDGSPDIRMHWYSHSLGYGFSIIGCRQDILLCELEEGDTISHSINWWSELSFPERQDYHAIKFEKEGNCYYGWFRTHAILTGQIWSFWSFDKSAYCTIPDYPLRVGQTSLSEGFEENSPASATIHPNPTKDFVTITGESLRLAEMVNMLGQQVFNMQGKGNELQIDMTALPAGIYFVNIIDEEGRKCVRKVVKE